MLFQTMIQFEKCFAVWLLPNFDSERNCDSFYSLALYREVLLVLGCKGLTPKLPWVTKTEFLLTISIQYQPDKWEE